MKFIHNYYFNMNMQTGVGQWLVRPTRDISAKNFSFKKCNRVKCHHIRRSHFIRSPIFTRQINKGDVPAETPTKAGIRFIDPIWMSSWVAQANWCEQRQHFEPGRPRASKYTRVQYATVSFTFFLAFVFLLFMTLIKRKDHSKSYPTQLFHKKNLKLTSR